jgi:hypothetical protein
MHGVLEVPKTMLNETYVHKINQQPNDTMVHHRYNMTCCIIFGDMNGKLLMVHPLNCRGEIGKWIALIVVVLRLFFPRHFPGMTYQFGASPIMLYCILAIMDVHCISQLDLP